MTDYRVQIDVIFTGDLYITANSEKEAKERARKMRLVPSDLKNFYWIDTRVIDVEEEI